MCVSDRPVKLGCLLNCVTDDLLNSCPPSLLSLSLALSLILLCLWLVRRPKRTLLLWTGASSWLKRSWIELRRDSPQLCRNWRRQRRLQMRVRGVCALELDEPSPKHWIIEINGYILYDPSNSVLSCYMMCDFSLIPVLVCSTFLTHHWVPNLMQCSWFKPTSTGHFFQSSQIDQIQT